MRIIPSSATLQSERSHAVTVGIFDGVHVGHQVLVRKAIELARHDQIASLAYTFTPHPAQVLIPAKAPKLLEPVEIRLERLQALGLDAVLLERFNAEFAAMSAERFVDDMLLGKLLAKHVVIGTGFTFGAGGRGTTALLAERCAAAGATVHVIPPVVVGGDRVSSTRIRTLVAEGQLREAATLLGHPVELVGLAMRGQQRGKKLGFATANLAVVNDHLPRIGVYAALATGPFGRFAAVVNIGTNPTFGGDAVRVEAHLLDFEARELYGMTIMLTLVERLRDEQKFSGANALVAQIEQDVQAARGVLSTYSL